MVSSLETTAILSIHNLFGIFGGPSRNYEAEEDSSGLLDLSFFLIDISNSIEL